MKDDRKHAVRFVRNIADSVQGHPVKSTGHMAYYYRREINDMEKRIWLAILIYGVIATVLTIIGINCI